MSKSAEADENMNWLMFFIIAGVIVFGLIILGAYRLFKMWRRHLRYIGIGAFLLSYILLIAYAVWDIWRGP